MLAIQNRWTAPIAKWSPRKRLPSIGTPWPSSFLGMDWREPFFNYAPDSCRLAATGQGCQPATRRILRNRMRAVSSTTNNHLDGLTLYVEVSSLLTKHLTGIGRFTARLVEALARLVPLRLVNTIQGEHARSMNLSSSLVCGQEIALAGQDLRAADDDVGAWARRLFHRPRY